jgi:hypothetical protein
MSRRPEYEKAKLDSSRIDISEKNRKHPHCVQRRTSVDQLLPRQMDSLEIARRDGRVDVERLAAHFDKTSQTRRYRTAWQMP